VRAGVPADVLSSLEAAARSASSAGSRAAAATQADGAEGPRPPTSTDATIISPAPKGPSATDATLVSPQTRPASSSDATLIAGSAPGSGGTAVSSSAPTLPRRAGRLTRVGKYEILDELGRGGMGVVYKARHPGLDRVVALKTLIATGSPEHVERFLREARSAARMGKHPNLVQVHDVGEEAGVYYFTMEFIEGESFDREIHLKKPDPRRVATVVEQVARGLAQAHAEGIVHRDLKPANILVDGGGRPLVTDFGLAKEVGAGSSVSVAGQVLGTPAYMSPEQAEGKLDTVGERSDVYGLGTILYEGLTRKPPFEGAGNIELLRKVTGTDPVPPSRLAPGVPRDLEVICLKCLAKRPDDRYDSAAALADDLKRFLDGEPILARPVPFAVRLARKVRKNLLVVGLGAAAAALLAAGTALTVNLVREKQRKDREAIERAEEARREEARRKRVDERLLRGRQHLEKAEKAMRPDVVAIAGQAASREPIEAALSEFDAALTEAKPKESAAFEARRLRAKALRFGGQAEASVAEAELALDIRDDPETRYDRALARLDVLRAALGTSLSVDYTHYAALGGQGVRRVVSRRDPGAERLLAEVRSELGGLSGKGLAAAPSLYLQGMLASLEDRHADALASFDAALAEDRLLVEAVRARAAELIHLRRYDEARAAYADLVRALPFDPAIAAEFSWLQVEYAPALKAADEAVRLAPKAAWVYRLRGMVHYNFDEPGPARADFEKALEISKDDPEALEGLFMVTSLCGDYARAEALGLRTLEADPEDFDLWFQMGIFYRNVGRATDAIACMDRALSLDPGFPLYLWARGRCRLLAGLYADGVRDMFDAVENGDVPQSLRAMFEGLRRTTEKNAASTTDPEELGKFAENLAGLLRLAAGSVSTERREQINASLATLMWVGSEMYEKAERWDKALDLLSKFESAHRLDWTLAYRRARICAQKYDKPAAFRYLREAKSRGMTSLGAVRMDPGFRRLRDADEWQAYEEEHEGGP
jgi:tetratricopeptide (TPR) repeat protein/tRNA A-37 threonylcarbamoyl transferase component Bud32